jgi:hypothetical protein
MLAILAAAIVLLAGCGGSTGAPASDQIAQPIATKVATETPRPTATPTPQEEPEKTSPIATPESGQIVAVSPLPTEEPQSRGVNPVNVPNPQQQLVARAVRMLADELNIDVAQVSVVSVEMVDWNDASLGCPKPGNMYAQVITPGYRIILEAGGAQYHVHTTLDPKGPLVRCNRP